MDASPLRAAPPRTLPPSTELATGDRADASLLGFLLGLAWDPPLTSSLAIADVRSRKLLTGGTSEIFLAWPRRRASPLRIGESAPGGRGGPLENPAARSVLAMLANEHFPGVTTECHSIMRSFRSSSSHRSGMLAHATGSLRKSARSSRSAKSCVAHIACFAPSICATSARVIPSSAMRSAASPVMCGRSPFASIESDARFTTVSLTEFRRPKNWSMLPLTHSVGTSRLHRDPNKPRGALRIAAATKPDSIDDQDGFDATLYPLERLPAMGDVPRSPAEPPSSEPCSVPSSDPPRSKPEVDRDGGGESENGGGGGGSWRFSVRYVK